MDNRNLVVGDLIILSGHHDYKKGVTSSRVTKLTATTAQLECGAKMKLETYNGEVFKFKRWSAVPVSCDIRGHDFTFNIYEAFLYTEEKFKKLKDEILDEMVEEKKREIIKEERAEAIKPFNKKWEELEKEMNLKLRDYYITCMCNHCKYKKANGTCALDVNNYIGEISTTDYILWNCWSICRFEKEDK